MDAKRVEKHVHKMGARKKHEAGAQLHITRICPMGVREIPVVLTFDMTHYSCISSSRTSPIHSFNRFRSSRARFDIDYDR